MMEILVFIIAALLISCPISFISGLIAFLVTKNENTKKIGQKMMVYGAIGFVIGFGGCVMLLTSGSF